jgi:outer membrane protein assembly factor BamB
MVLIVILLWQLPTDQEAFDEADSIYRSGNWNAATQAFDKFLTWRADSPLAGQARVKQDLSILRLALEQGKDATELLRDIDEAIKRWGTLRRQVAAEQGLADLLPPLVADLMREAQSAAEQSATESANAAFAKSQAAMELIYQFVPPRLQEQQGVDQLLTELIRLEREFNQPAELREAIRRIDAAGEEGGMEAAYQQRIAFLGKHPELATNGRLNASMRSVARAEATRVRFEAGIDNLDVGETEQNSAVQLQVLFSSKEVENDTNVTAGALVLATAPASNAVMAIDASSLGVRWRYAVGATDALPVSCRDAVGSGVVLADQRSQSLARLDAKTGEILWRTRVPRLVGQPLVVADKALVSTRDGQLMELELSTGRIAQLIRFSVEFRQGPAAIGVGERLVQLGEHSVVFLLSRESRRCLHSYYLGHELGSVCFPPLVHADEAIVVEKISDEQSRLHVLSLGDQLALVASIRLDGRVSTPPVIHQGVVYLSTSDGRLHTVRHTPDDKRRPYRLGPSVVFHEQVVARDGAAFLTVKAGRIWAGGRGLAVLQPAVGEHSPQMKRLASALRVTQPLHATPASQHLFCIGVEQDSRLRVQRWDAEQQRLDASATPFYSSAARLKTGDKQDELWNLDEEGTLFKLNGQDLWNSTNSNHVVHGDLRLVGTDGPGHSFYSQVSSHGRYAGFASASNNELVFVPLSGDDAPAKVPVGGALAGPAVPFGNHWMVAARHGAIGLIDREVMQFASETFLPSAASSGLLRWSIPIVTDDHRAVVYDGDRTLFMIRHVSGLPTLESEFVTTLESRLTTRLVQVGSRIWSVNEERQLIAFHAASLECETAIALPAAQQWGPEPFGDYLLLRTVDGTLMCVADAKEPSWQTTHSFGPVVGACQLGSEQIMFASRGGVLWRVRVDNGQQVGEAIELGQPLASGPDVFANRLFVVAADGTFLFIRQSEAEGRAGTEVAEP